MAFDSRNFQDKILQNIGRNLFGKYNFLRLQFNEAVLDLSKDGDLQDGIGRIANGLKWIFRNHTRRPGVTLVQDVWDARKVLIRQGELLHNSKSMGKMITDDDLIKKGLTEEVYYDTLDKVLKFFAWAYDLQIYEQITNMIDEMGSKKDSHSRMPEEELNRLSIDSLAQNPTPRIPVIFIVDNSVSMDQNGCLNKLDQGLTELIEMIRSNSTLSHQLDLYIATCGGGAKEIVNFDTIDRLESQLNNFMILPYGRCMMASAIELALRRLDERIQHMRDPEINVDMLNCPWMIVLSNGRFAQDMTEVNKLLAERINERKLMVYWRALSPTANIEVLSRQPAQESGKVKVLDNVNGFFKDINNSLQAASKSVPGCHVELLNKSGFVE